MSWCDELSLGAYGQDNDAIFDNEEDKSWEEDAGSAGEDVEGEIGSGRGVRGKTDDTQDEVQQEDADLR